LVDGLELLSKLLSFSAGTLAVLDICAKSRSNGSDLFDGRDVGVRFEVSDSGLNFASNGLDISHALNSTLNSAKDSVEETLSELFSSVS